MNNKSLLVAVLISCIQIPVFANDASENITTSGEGNWGIAFTWRSANIPYEIPNTQADEKRVSDFVPIIYYEDKYVFWRGLQAGIKIKTNDRWEFNLLGRYRFFDIPADIQNTQNIDNDRGNGVDLGVQYRYKVSPGFNADFELLDDTHGRRYVSAIANSYWGTSSWDLFPYARLRWKSNEYNNRYYGLDGLLSPEFSASPGSALDLTFGATLRYHVISNLYLLGSLSVTMLDKTTYQASTISTPTQNEVYIGFGFFNQKKKKRRALKAKQYVRLAHGWATPTNLGEILKFNTESDEFNNQLSSVFYGIPVADALFGAQIPIYFTPGIVLHQKSTVQKRSAEYVLAIKGYSTIKWPTTWRVGLAGGFSYVSDITYIEQKEMDEKGYRPSNLMTYLDFSADIELGDLFNSRSMKDWWLGYSIHHRSAIFESASAFGRIKGGSNYNTVYLQYHF